MTHRFTTINQVISYIRTKNYTITKNMNLEIKDFKSILSAKKGEMTFCSTTKNDGIKIIKASKASLIICPLAFKNKNIRTNSVLVFVDKPRLVFLRCLKKFLKINELHDIHSTAIIKSKKIGKNVYIGPFSYVGKNVVIGDNTIIHGHVNIYGNSNIGRNVIIDSFTVIGSDGFGFEKNENGDWEKFPHIGNVEIKDDVEIGANVCIDRGTLESTVIGTGTKIDNLVHIAHNVKIGKNCMVVAHSLLGGSCILGDGVYIAMSAVIRDGIKIGTGAMIGMGSVVTRNVDDGITVIGVPAHPIKKIR